jgi:hypothetical protein
MFDLRNRAAVHECVGREVAHSHLRSCVRRIRLSVFGELSAYCATLLTVRNSAIPLKCTPTGHHRLGAVGLATSIAVTALVFLLSSETTSSTAACLWHHAQSAIEALLLEQGRSRENWASVTKLDLEAADNRDRVGCHPLSWALAAFGCG